jgi:hypothetical protein
MISWDMHIRRHVLLSLSLSTKDPYIYREKLVFLFFLQAIKILLLLGVPRPNSFAVHQPILRHSCLFIGIFFVLHQGTPPTHPGGLCHYDPSSSARIVLLCRGSEAQKKKKIIMSADEEKQGDTAEVSEDTAHQISVGNDFISITSFFYLFPSSPNPQGKTVIYLSLPAVLIHMLSIYQFNGMADSLSIRSVLELLSLLIFFTTVDHVSILR